MLAVGLGLMYHRVQRLRSKEYTLHLYFLHCHFYCLTVGFFNADTKLMPQHADSITMRASHKIFISNIYRSFLCIKFLIHKILV